MEVMDSSNGDGGGSSTGSSVVEIYPLSCYYFGSKDAILDKDDSLADRLQRLKANYAVRGMRTCVHGVLLVELFQHPHVLLLQIHVEEELDLNDVRVGNAYTFVLKPPALWGYSDIEGLKRKLSSKLSDTDNSTDDDWQIGDCVGMWWRSEFETSPFPYLPPNTPRPKECTKLFLVKMPATRQFVVPRNLKMLAVPLCQLHGNSETYGPVISGIPQVLSRFSFDIIRPDF